MIPVSDPDYSKNPWVRVLRGEAERSVWDGIIGKVLSVSPGGGVVTVLFTWRDWDRRTREDCLNEARVDFGHEELCPASKVDPYPSYPAQPVESCHPPRSPCDHGLLRLERMMLERWGGWRHRTVAERAGDS